MADDETRTNAESGELFTPPGPRRASYTPPANDEAARLAAAKVFTDDAIAEALAAEFASFDPRPPVPETVPVDVSTLSEPVAPIAQSAPSPDLPPPLYLHAPAPTVPPADAPPPPGYESVVATPPATTPMAPTPAETIDEELPSPDERLRDRSAREFTAWEASMLEDGSPDALASLAQARREEPDFRFASEAESESSASPEPPRVEPAIELASEAPADEQVESGVLDFHFADFDFPPPATPKTLPTPEAAGDPVPDERVEVESEQSAVQFPGFAPPTHEPFPGFAPDSVSTAATALPTEPPSTPPVIPAYTPEPPAEAVPPAAQFPPLLMPPTRSTFDPPPLVEPPTADSRPESPGQTPSWDFVLPASPEDAGESLEVPVAPSPEERAAAAPDAHANDEPERPEFDALLTGPIEPLSPDYVPESEVPGSHGEEFGGVEALGLGAAVTPPEAHAAIDETAESSPPPEDTGDSAPSGKTGPFWRRRRSR